MEQNCFNCKYLLIVNKGDGLCMKTANDVYNAGNKTNNYKADKECDKWERRNEIHYKTSK